MIFQLHKQPPILKAGGTDLGPGAHHRQDLITETPAKDLRAVACLLGSELFGGSFSEELSLANDSDSRTKLLGLRQIMCCQEHGDAFAAG